MIRINDIHDSRIDVFTRLREPQLKTLYEPAPGVFIAESILVISRALKAGYEPLSLLLDEKLLSDKTVQEILTQLTSGNTVSDKSNDNSAGNTVSDKNNDNSGNVLISDDSAAADGILTSARIFTADSDLLKGITGSELTGGIMCCMRRQMLPDPQELCRDAKRIAILERVMNPTNVGAIMRSAAAMHMDAVLLTPDCSDPLYRRAARVSMGTVFQIPWTYVDSALNVRSFGFKLASMALTDDVISIDDPQLKTEERLAIVLGSEHDGLLPETIAGSDYVVKIPMREGIDSLNVAAASAVAFWELR